VNDDHDLNDTALLTAVQVSVSRLPLPAAPQLAAITARGRARRRRTIGFSLACTGACAALAAGLAFAGPAAPHEAPPARLAAFSVTDGPHGTTIVTISEQAFVSDPEALRQALAAHGIPALVEVSSSCLIGGRVDYAVAGQVLTRSSADPTTFVINGPAIPKGQEVIFSYLHQATKTGKGGTVLGISLAPIGAPLSCFPQRAR
jgi:hypothetical protein